MDSEEILSLRRDHKLHEVVEKRFKELIEKVAPGSYTLLEGYGTTSGRTDTTSFTGKIIHMELIASKSMVNNDLVNLHQSSADLPIAIILDEKFDPGVAEAYFSSNPKDIFTRLWLSEILDPDKEEKTLGKLEQILHDLEKKEGIKQYNSEKKFLNVIRNYNATFQLEMGIIPRKFVRTFDELKDQALFEKYNRVGLNEAANPHGFMYGYTYKFTQGASFFSITAPAVPDSPIHTSLDIGKDGDIFFSQRDNREIYNELSASGVHKVLNGTLNFAVSLFEENKFSGPFDVFVHLKGVKDFQWFEKGTEENPVARMLNGRKFAENEISTEAYTCNLEQIKDHDQREKFFDYLFLHIYRHTEQIPLK